MPGETGPVIITVRNDDLPDLPPFVTPYLVEGNLKVPNFEPTNRPNNILDVSELEQYRKLIKPTNVKGVDAGLRHRTYRWGRANERGRKYSGWVWIPNGNGELERVSGARNEPQFNALMAIKIDEFNRSNGARRRLASLSQNVSAFEKGASKEAVKDELLIIGGQIVGIGFEDYALLADQIIGGLGLAEQVESERALRFQFALRKAKKLPAFDVLTSPKYDPIGALAPIIASANLYMKNLGMLRDWEIATLDPYHQAELIARRKMDIAHHEATLSRRSAA